MASSAGLEMVAVESKVAISAGQERVDARKGKAECICLLALLMTDSETGRTPATIELGWATRPVFTVSGTWSPVS